MNNARAENRRGSLEARELFQTAQKLFVEGLLRESIEVFSQFLEMRGDTEIALLSRGVAYLRTNQTERAVEDFSRVIAMNDQSMRAFFYRGTALMFQKDYEGAIRDFDRTIELKPDYGAAFFARGSAYVQTGNKLEAARNIKTAITLSEANLQGFADTVGLFRTQFDKAMAVMADREKIPGMTLTEDELKKVRRWLDEPDH